MKRTSIVAVLMVIIACGAVIGAASRAFAFGGNPPVDLPQLVPFLPEAPEGWTTDKPEQIDARWKDYRFPTVKRTYVKGKGDNAPSTTITIIDFWGYKKYYTMATEKWVASETADGYDKAVTVSGCPGWEHVSKEKKECSLTLVVGRRYLVTVEAKHQNPKALTEWMDRINLKTLAAMVWQGM